MGIWGNSVTMYQALWTSNEYVMLMEVEAFTKKQRQKTPLVVNSVLSHNMIKNT